MRFKPNQQIQVAPGFPCAGRIGTLLKTFKHLGKQWHLVIFEGQAKPEVVRFGTITITKASKKLSKSSASTRSRS